MIKNLLSDDEPDRKRESRSSVHTPSSSVLNLFDSGEQDESAAREGFSESETEPEMMAETIRRSGLAYSAGIALFAAVVFMMILGWGADLLFGSSPWGIVGGIVVGSVIGFVQFFRLTSQIFKK